MKQITRLALVLAMAGSTVCSLASAQDHPFETDELRKPSLRTGGNCLITNVTVHSAVGPARRASVLVTSGDIAAIGPELEAPEGCVVIDGGGGHLTPGVIDCHSHMAIEGGINEGTLSITCDVDISDVVNADDLTIYRALAGGTTTARLLHGSANAIGGRHEVIKLRWHKGTEDLRFDQAPEGVKFALGENPKRAGGGGGRRGGGAGRFPGTRMGVEAVFYRAFSRAREYKAEWEAYEAARAAGQDPVPVRRDLRLDILLGIQDGTVDVHSHCYRADEILMLLRAAEHFGFRVKTLQHVLEGYKVAHEIAEHGAGGSTFGDWWAYKIEAYDAIPQNAALMDEAGVLTSLNSDSGEMVRRLFSEAAKSVRYARMDPVRALALVTIYPAKQLGIDRWVGSIEKGKDADLVLHTGDPLSALSRVEWTLVDGEVEFQRRDAFELDSNPPPVPELSEIDHALVEAGWTPEGGETVAIVGATIHPITAPAIEDGTLVMQGGRIVYVGPAEAVPASARVIDAAGQHVWPGIVALGTGLGLNEIGQVTATTDDSEIGGNQPDLRVSAALFAESAHIPVTRYNGITRAQSAPQGGGPIRGQSSVIRLTGDTWEELVMVDRDMLQVSFPRVSNDAKDKDKKKKSEGLKNLEQLFEDGREYARLVDDARELGSALPPFEPRLAALAPYARGEKRVAIHANNAQTILSALRFIQEQELDGVLYGVSEGWKVVDALAEAQVPVVVGPVLAVPSSKYDPYDASYANVAVLARAGVPYAIMSDDGENPRNVAFHAAMASAFGLPHDEALRSITYYAARALGLEGEIGSLAPGKIADVVITDGDLLEITTHVDAVFIDGVQAPLVNRQTQFYDRYRSRLMSMQER
jgi:imidazolonepropionase-like amidohydrolase